MAQFLFQGLAPLLIVVVGALLARRWRELPLVALAGLAGTLIVALIVDQFTWGDISLPPLNTVLMLFVFSLLVAAIAHGAKRLLKAFFARRAAAAPAD